MRVDREGTRETERKQFRWVGDISVSPVCHQSVTKRIDERCAEAPAGYIRGVATPQRVRVGGGEGGGDVRVFATPSGTGRWMDMCDVRERDPNPTNQP